MAAGGFRDGPARNGRFASASCAPTVRCSARTSHGHGNRFRKPSRRSTSTHPGKPGGPCTTAEFCNCASDGYLRRVNRPRVDRSSTCRASSPVRRHTTADIHIRSTHGPTRPCTTSGGTDETPRTQPPRRHISCLYHRRQGRGNVRRNLGSLLLAALAVAAAVACYCTSSTAAVRDSCKAIGGRAKPPRQRNVHSVLTQNCLGMKSATRKTELISVLRQREPLAVCLQ